MTAATGPKDRKRPIRKEQVARVTWQLLAKNGFESTSMREIAKALGTTTGTLTHYFRNKEDMVEFTNQFMYELVVARLHDAAAGDRANRLWRSIRALLPVKKAHLDNHRVWLSFVTSGFGRPRLRNRNRRILAGHIGHIRGMVADDRTTRGRESGLDADDEAYLLICLTEGLSTLATVDRKSFSPERVSHLAKIGFDLIVEQAKPQQRGSGSAVVSLASLDRDGEAPDPDRVGRHERPGFKMSTIDS